MKSGLLEQRARKGYYAVDIDTDVMGLGARIVNMIEILSYCDIKKYIPVFKFSYREKVNEDYFGELFSYKNLPVSILMTLQFTKIRDTSDLKWKNYDKKLSLTIAKDLFDKYFSFNQAILDEMDSFVRKWFLGKHVLGIHYRGSDKITEAPCVPLESLHKHVIEILEKEPSINLIFISSDETAVIHSLMSLQLPVSVVCRQDAIRSENGKQIHLQRQNSKTVINRDAIVNCLLLSKCNYLLKTASLLSDCSVIFNPTLKVLVLNAPYEHVTWWPTSEINKMENWHNVTIS
ncbi:MAG: hypothetical protein LBR97_09510 [Dysgonamonadaceae bacterium]|nr:hypothetical protein [Dysgonamonadaceae bacterium]